jgi:flagellar biosynthesis/type III secretory pathway M-ring protein FliF/YscJ
VLTLDPLTLLLVIGVVVLVITTTITGLGFLPAARQRRRSRHPLTPSAAHMLAVAQARAATHEAALESAGVATNTRRSPGQVTGQIIEISDHPFQGRGMTVEYAQALADHVAETDPQLVAEVISQWIRADSKIDHDLFH